MKLLALIALFFPLCAVADPPELTIMTFNVRYGTARDLGNSWGYRRDLLVETIKQQDPDLLGTQECLEFQADYIVEKLPEYRWFGIGRDKDGTGEMTAIFYRHRAFAPIQTGTFWLSEDRDRPGSMSWDTSLTRIITWAKFLHRKSGLIFYFGDTHFDHRGEKARENSARLLADEVQGFPGDVPVILVGDFNSAAEKSAPWEVLTESAMKDAWLHAREQVGPAVTFGGFLPPNEENGNRIDWILYRGPLAPQRCETVLTNDEGRYPSDHFPVVCHFQVVDAEKSTE
ncbi:MAG: endonuclease/exonuclease/phosphatase family protein [Candidatus Hydrogenedentes bacterium]|nr:endonuclease/exonuclease/phosphatase family protein [Candidatus Hydrogenedentota bacterium]